MSAAHLDRGSCQCLCRAAHCRFCEPATRRPAQQNVPRGAEPDTPCRRGVPRLV